MIKENTIEGYFNLDESNDLGDTHHSGAWSKDHLDPTNTWGNGMCFVYYNRNCSFKLKQEIWQKYTSKIIKLGDMELLTNDTPFLMLKSKKLCIRNGLPRTTKRSDLPTTKEQECEEPNKRRWRKCN